MTAPCACGTGCGRQATPGRMGLARACYQRWRNAGYPREGSAPKVPPAVDRAAESRHQRAEFAALRSAGVNVPAATDRIGVHVVTGWRWEGLRKRGQLLPEPMEVPDGQP